MVKTDKVKIIELEAKLERLERQYKDEIHNAIIREKDAIISKLIAELAKRQQEPHGMILGPPTFQPTTPPNEFYPRSFQKGTSLWA